MADRKSRLQARMESKKFLAVPAEYFSDTMRRQLCSLLYEDSLKDVVIELRGSIVNVNSCILSMLSPVLRAMVCGNFKESICRKIVLDDIVEEQLMKLLRIGCGEEGIVAEDFEEMLGLGELADRLRMEVVRSEIEDKLLSQLKLDNCLEMLQRIEASGLARLQKACYDMLRDNFEVLSQKTGILKLSEATMENLLEDDELEAGREEVTFEALLGWMRSGEGMRGEGLLRKIRYGVMRDEYLLLHLSSAVLLGHEEMQQLIKEALTKKGVNASNSGNASVWDGIKRLCEKWMVARGMKGRMIGADVLKVPKYVAIDGQGRIIVSDHELDEILIFNRDGSIASRFGSSGGAVGQFRGPRGIAVDRQGHIVVADQGNNRIQVLNVDGSVVRCFGTLGDALGQLHRPQGVAIDIEGHIVVTDSGNDRIQIFNMDGSGVRHFDGSENNDAGQLGFPKGVAVDAIGRIVVADSCNNRVQVFNCDGSVALCFGSEGDGPGEFREPYGVAVDKEGRFFVTDLKDQVEAFNPDGSVARVIGSSGEGVGHLRHPYGVAVDKAGRIFVAEGYFGLGEGESDSSDAEWRLNNHRVQVF